MPLAPDSESDPRAAAVSAAMAQVQRTSLPPEQEEQYQAWRQKIGMTAEKGMNMTPDGTGTDYDMRGYFAKYGATAHADGQHFTDEFKLPNHPTFSDQSKFATGPAAVLAGHWNGDTYVPAASPETPSTQLTAAGPVVSPQLPPMADEDGTGANGAKYTSLDILEAAARQSIVGRAGHNFQLMQQTGYNPLTTVQPEVAAPIPDEMLPYKDKYVGLYTPEEITYRTAQIKQELKDQQAMGSSKWGGVANIAMGVTDPVALASMAVPIAGEARLAIMARSAMVGAGVSAADEALMHQMNPLATYEGSGVNIGAGALISGLLGGLIRPNVPKAEFERMRAHLQEDFEAPTASPPPVTAGDNAADIARDVRAAVAAHETKLTAAAETKAPGAADELERFRAATAAPEAEAARPEATASEPTATTSEIENRFRDYLTNNNEEAKTRYSEHPETQGGRVLNVDTARELSPDYLADRTRSADVHEPASAFIKERYAQMLKEPPKEGQDPTVLFTAGGTGAGKSSALHALGGAAERAQIVYDTNMNSLASARTKIEQALAAGKDIKIAYVYRDPVEALQNGALKRAMRQEAKHGTGRTVPLDKHLETHLGSYETIHALSEEYAGNPHVDITAIDNSRGAGAAAAVPLESIPKLDYNNLHERATQALESARDAGPERGGISESVYRGFKGAEAEQPAGRGAGQQSEQERARGLSSLLARAPSVPLKRAIGDPVLREQLQAMSDTESGWWQEGGQLLRDVNDEVTGRTPWIPNAEWWPGRPGGYNAEEVQNIVRKALAGERLGSKQQALVEYMTEVADARVANESYLPHAGAFEGLDEHLTAGNVADEHETAMVTRLSLIDEAAVENLARHFEEDHVGFLREVRRMLDAHDTDASLARSLSQERDTPGEPVHGTATERSAGSPGSARQSNANSPLVDYERAESGRPAAAEPALNTPGAQKPPAAEQPHVAGERVESGGPGRQQPPVERSVTELLQQLPADQRAEFEARLAALEPAPIIAAPGDSTAGAQQVGANLTLKDLTLARGGRVLGKALGWFAPGSRVLRSPSFEVRKGSIALMETPEMLEMNVPSPERPTGVPTPPAVETILKRWEGTWAQGFRARDELYRAYRAKLALPGEIGGERLGKRQFNEAVSAAMRRGDLHPIPEVQKAAQETRRLVFDPLKVEAQRLGLMPQQDSTLGGTAESYLMRQYDRAKIRADRAGWHTLLRDGFIAQGVDSAEADGVAHQVTRNLLGSEMGLLDLNDVVFRDMVPSSGRLQARTILLPDTLLEHYLSSDIDHLSHAYLKSLAPQVEVTKRFGDKDLQGLFQKVTDEYSIMTQRALAEGNDAGANALSDRLRADLRDLSAMRDRLYGIFGVSADPTGWWQRAGRVIRSVNAFRMLGSATWSHIPDAANVIMRHGLPGTMAAAAKLSTSLEALKLNRTELQRLGTALDMVHNSTAAQLGEFGVDSNYAFQKFLNRGTRAFTIATLETPWIASIKAWAGAVAHDQILETAERASSGGKLSANERIRMNQAGLGQGALERIADQFRQFGRQVNGLRFGMSDKWTDEGAQLLLEAAVNKHAEGSTLSPSKGDTPLWTSTEIGKSIFQFKTFGAVAIRKVVIPLAQGLAHADLRSAQGLATLVAAGAATYTMKQLLAGQPIEKDPKRYALEVLDKSNLLGWAGEYFYPMLWQAGMSNFSRWGDRQTWETLGGPVAGTAVDAWDLRIPAKLRGQMSGDPTQTHFSRADIHRIRRMLPGNQVWYLRRAVNTLEGKVGDGMGLPPATPQGSTE